MEVAAVFIIIASPTIIILPILLMIHFSNLQKRKDSSFILWTLIFLLMFPAGITIGAILGRILDKLHLRVGSSDFISSIYIFIFYVVVPIYLFRLIMKKSEQIKNQKNKQENKSP